MTFQKFFFDRAPVLLGQLLLMFLSDLFFRLAGMKTNFRILYLLIWLVFLCLVFLVSFLRKKKHFDQCEEILSQLDQPCLLGEMLPESIHLEDQIYRELLRRSNQSGIELLHRTEDEQQEYRDYITGWVHEIKAPITAISLLCENNRRKYTDSATEFRQIAMENQRIEQFADQVFYYARSEMVYQDFFIRPCVLDKVVAEEVLKNKWMLMNCQASVQTDCPHTVYTDEKWIRFILSQLLQNSMKYRSSESLKIHISSQTAKGGICLSVLDNGIGVLPEELPRIFEKGFTGSNGRSRERSTGLGLYLCQRLCDQLKIQLDAKVELSGGLRIMLTFPISHHITEIQEHTDI